MSGQLVAAYQPYSLAHQAAAASTRAAAVASCRQWCAAGLAIPHGRTALDSAQLPLSPALGLAGACAGAILSASTLLWRTALQRAFALALTCQALVFLGCAFPDLPATLSALTCYHCDAHVAMAAVHSTPKPVWQHSAACGHLASYSVSAGHAGFRSFAAMHI